MRNRNEEITALVTNYETNHKESLKTECEHEDKFLIFYDTYMYINKLEVNLRQ